jgi:hypothetical protein
MTPITTASATLSNRRARGGASGASLVALIFLGFRHFALNPLAELQLTVFMAVSR